MTVSFGPRKRAAGAPPNYTTKGNHSLRVGRRTGRPVLRPSRGWFHFQDMTLERIRASSERTFVTAFLGPHRGPHRKCGLFRYCCCASAGRHNHLTRLSSLRRSNLLAIPLGVPCCWMPNDGLKRPLDGLVERFQPVAATPGLDRHHRPKLPLRRPRPSPNQIGRRRRTLTIGSSSFLCG
ncbi:hypothetical protein LX36DRAFT_201826 [Colletotrichum falcatum]|nr:hypothetical protein LX36DRAFT_201826 [Colletotrichum falcatum]